MGFDMRKNHELLLFAEETGIKVPVIANLYVPTLGTAKNIFRGAFPGCSVTEVLINELAVESKAADKGIMTRFGACRQNVCGFERHGLQWCSYRWF